MGDTGGDDLLPATKGPPLFTHDEFVQAVLKYKDNTNTNPTNPNGTCLYLQDQTHRRCLIGQVLTDLGAPMDIPEIRHNKPAGMVMAALGAPAPTRALAGRLQGVADGDYGSPPVPWGPAIRDVLGEELAASGVDD